MCPVSRRLCPGKRTLPGLWPGFRKPRQDCGALPTLPAHAPGPKSADSLPGPAERRKRAVALRKERNLSVEEIGAILAQEGTPVSASAVNRMLREAGLPKL